MVAEVEERTVPHDKVAGRRRRMAVFLALPSLVVFVGIGLIPIALIATWSLWSFDPDTYWIKPVWSLASYAALLKQRASDGPSPNSWLGCTARSAVYYSVLH